MIIRGYLLCWFFLSIIISGAQDVTPGFAVMFYNVENLFDTNDDPITADEEFLPSGVRRWTNKRLAAKLNNLAKVIINTGEWEPPAVIGLCEIENRYVLERLISQPGLRNWNYRIIHKDSPDERGIDVAAIYRDDLFVPISYSYFYPEVSPADPPSTREILYVCGIAAGADTVHLFFNHWPSRYGGLMETRKARQNAADRLSLEVGLLQSKYCNPRIIIMGDFNDQPDDLSMTRHLKANTETGTQSDVLYNLSYQWYTEGRGTLKYQSEWNVFDQIVVSGSLLGGTGNFSVRPEDAVIVESSFLFMVDERYTGRKLNRTYEGYRYAGGYSDHLPVLLHLRLK
jgi:hypothetical protein